MYGSGEDEDDDDWAGLWTDRKKRQALTTTTFVR